MSKYSIRLITEHSLGFEDPDLEDFLNEEVPDPDLSLAPTAVPPPGDPTGSVPPSSDGQSLVLVPPPGAILPSEAVSPSGATGPQGTLPQSDTAPPPGAKQPQDAVPPSGATQPQGSGPPSGAIQCGGPILSAVPPLGAVQQQAATVSQVRGANLPQTGHDFDLLDDASFERERRRLHLELLKQKVNILKP